MVIRITTQASADQINDSPSLLTDGVTDDCVVTLMSRHNILVTILAIRDTGADIRRLDGANNKQDPGNIQK